MANTVTVKDRGARQVVRSVGAASGKGPVLQVGLQGAKGLARHEGTALSVAEVALFHEFGLGVPERSWLRGWFDEHKSEIEEDLRKVTRGILLARFTKERGLEILGLKYVGQIQQRITSNIPPALAPSTIARKGSSVALVDTGQLKSAITYALGKAVA